MKKKPWDILGMFPSMDLYLVLVVVTLICVTILK